MSYDNEEIYKGYRIVYEIDEFATNPIKDYDTLATFSLFHPDYDLAGPGAFSGKDDLLSHIQRDDVLALTVYLYDHSGLSLHCGRVACDPQGWDTSRIGYAHITHEKIKEEYGNAEPETIEKVRGYIKGEIEMYSQYLQGDCWGFTIFDQLEEGEDDDATREELDSVWGFIGFEHCQEEARWQVDAYIDAKHEEQEAEAYARQQEPARQAMISAARWKGGRL